MGALAVIRSLAAAAALAATPTSAGALTRFVEHGHWTAGISFATAFVSTGFVDPGTYDVKFRSAFDIRTGSGEKYYLYRAHEETYDGVVLYDDVVETVLGPFSLGANGRPGFVTSLTQGPTYEYFGPDFFGYIYTKLVLSFRLTAPLEAAGEPFTFSVTPVPEPDVWILAIGGFAMTGLVARRARRSKAGRSRQGPVAYATRTTVTPPAATQPGRKVRS